MLVIGMVWVFRTTVDTKAKVERISQFMNATIGVGLWTFDLEDWEHVLRIESDSLHKIEKVKKYLQAQNFEIAEM